MTRKTGPDGTDLSLHLLTLANLGCKPGFDCSHAAAATA